MVARRPLLLLIARSTLLLVSLALVVCLFELGMRVAGYQAIYDVYSKPTSFWEHDELLGWSHMPGAEDVYVGPRPWPIEFETPVRINSLGLRGPELPEEQAGEHRVLFLGDSMVAAFEVMHEETFVHLLAEELTERTGEPVRGINAGVRGYGTDQSFLYFRERGHALDVDLVVFYHSRNDLLDNRTIHQMRRPLGKPAFVREGGELVLKGMPVPRYPMCSEYAVSKAGRIERLDGLTGRITCHLQLTLFDHSALFSFVTLRIPWDARFLRDLYYLGFAQKPKMRSERTSDRPAAILTRDLIGALRSEVVQRGADFLVIGEDDQLAELGVPELEQEGIEVLGLGDRGDITVTQFENDAHYTAAGHRRVVERIRPRLEALLRARSPEPAAGKEARE